MAASGRIELSCYNGSTGTIISGYAGYLTWDCVADAVTNTSTIRWTLIGWGVKQGTSYYESPQVTIKLPDGTEKTFSGNYRGDLPYGGDLGSTKVETELASGRYTFSNMSDGTADIRITGFYYQFQVNESIMNRCTGAMSISLPRVQLYAEIKTAQSFIDTEYPSMTYYNPAKASLTAYLSLDGQTPLTAIQYPEIDGVWFTFDITDAERETIRRAAKNSVSIPIYYVLVSNGGALADEVQVVERTVTIADCNPVISNVSFYDALHVDLTGNRDIIILNDNLVEYSFTAVASKSATLTSISVSCGTKTITDMTQGIIQDAESGIFVITVTDSRGLTTTHTVTKQTIDYVKPTCYQKIKMVLSGETDADVMLSITGNYFNNSFGGTANTLKLEVRYTNADGVMGSWIDLTAQGYKPTFNGNTYSLNVTLTGFDYETAYVFQCRATDVLNFVQSAQYTARLLPIFDWDDRDFNFNVPIKLNGEPVLRHNKDAKNTVVSGSGGSIYFRPLGSEDTEGEAKLSADGTFTVAAISFGSGDADFVVDHGTASMGSNGTWYWCKWNSGRAECYGSRNFGAMAVTTSWGNLYRSATFSQTLPQNLFIEVPESINIYLKDANYGGWIAKHEQTAPSNSETGSFIVVRPASATLSKSHIGFHIIGKWK